MLPFEQTIEAHWREHRPKRVRALEQQGRLRAAVQRAADLTTEAESRAIRSGVPPMQALEMFREQWAFLPTEEDVPDLRPNSNPKIR